MSEQAEMEPVAEAPAKADSVYVVQVFVAESAIALVAEEGKPVETWQDVATVTVPARTHRKRIIAKALTDAGIKPDPGQPAPRVRVLDGESAFVHEPGAEQPPAVWVVS